MKRVITILAFATLCQVSVLGQKKYEMVVEKTDGTETVFNVEDITRTYFREREQAENHDSYSSDDDDEGTPLNLQEASAEDLHRTLVNAVWSIREDIVEADEKDSMTETWTFEEDGTLIRSGVDECERYTDKMYYSISKDDVNAYITISRTNYTVKKFTSSSFELLHEWSDGRWSGSSKITGRKTGNRNIIK